MDFETVRHFLGGMAGATEEHPFDAHTLVFKVRGKMYALVAQDANPLRVTLKCDPMEAEALRAAFPAVKPGYYMHKAHWNTVTLDASISEELAREMMRDSHDLVVKALTKAERAALWAAAGEKMP